MSEVYYKMRSTWNLNIKFKNTGDLDWQIEKH